MQVHVTLLVAGVALAAMTAAGRAQEGRPESPLRSLQAAFAAAPANAARICIAIVGEEHWLLADGSDAGGAAASASTLLPLGSAARLLIADAVAAAAAERLDEVVAQAGTEALSVRTLLEGTPRLPDCYADTAAAAVDAAQLLACGEVVANAQTVFEVRRGSIGELVVLADHLLAPPTATWPAWLRQQLAPHGAGVDVVDLADLDATARDRLGLTPTAAGELAKSPFAASRLCMSAGDVAAWWRWHLQHELPNRQGCRAGRTYPVEGHAEAECWLWFAATAASDWEVAVYPGRRAALVQWRDRAGAADDGGVRRAFEASLFGRADAKPMLGGGFGGRMGPDASAIAGNWVAADSAHTGTLALYDWFGWRAKLEVDGTAYTLEDLFGRGPMYRLRLRHSVDADRDLLLLYRQGEGATERLLGVLVHYDDKVALPRRLDFARAPAEGDRDR